MPDELADRHNGISIDGIELQGMSTYEVTVGPNELEELPDYMDVTKFAEQIATSRISKTLEPSFRIDADDTLAQSVDSRDIDGEKFKVFVRFAQSE